MCIRDRFRVDINGTQGVNVGVYLQTGANAMAAAEAVKARIAEAAKYVPLVQLCLSPQCGFSSTEEGNIMTEEEQWAKVRLVVEIAREVWQDA